MDVEVTSAALAAMRAAAAAAHPHEACGLLLGEGAHIAAVRATRNVHPAPGTRFEIDPQALINAHRAARGEGAPQVVGYFHSHPRGAPAPSAADQACAARDGRIWAIVAGEEVRFWQDAKEGFRALSYRVVQG